MLYKYWILLGDIRRSLVSSESSCDAIVWWNVNMSCMLRNSLKKETSEWSRYRNRLPRLSNNSKKDGSAVRAAVQNTATPFNALLRRITAGICATNLILLPSLLIEDYPPEHSWMGPWLDSQVKSLMDTWQALWRRLESSCIPRRLSFLALMFNE